MSILQTSELPKALAEALSDTPRQMYLYLEYCTSGTTPTAPSGVLADPKAYYTGLGANFNYLRVKAVRDPNVVSTSTGTPTYTTSVRFFGATDGTTTKMNSGGANFVDGVKCYGAALVLGLDPSDATKDLVMARSYFVSNVLIKTSGSELFVTFTFSSTAS